MLETILLFIQTHVGNLNGWITTALHGNSIVAGAATASIIASLFYVLRKVPSYVSILLRKNFLYTYTLEYCPFANNTPMTEIAKNFEVLVQNHISKKRNQSAISIVKKKLVESLSYGSFYYHWDTFFVKIDRSIKENSGKNDSSNELIVLTFTTFVWNRYKILAKLSTSAGDYTGNKVFVLNAGYNGVPEAFVAAPIDTTSVLVMEEGAKRQIDEALDNFLKHRQENNLSGAKHKLVLMLYGEPGTGKSSVGEYIAKKLNTSLFCMNSTSAGSRMEMTPISKCIGVIKNNISPQEIPLLLCDDFDTIWRCGNRLVPSTTVVGLDNKPAPGYDSADVGMLLTNLQSPTEVRDCVIIFTVNDLSKIDPAIYRPGRVDLLLEIGRMQPKCVKEYFSIRYNAEWPKDVVIERALRGCDISSYYTANKNNPQGFINAVCSGLAEDEQFQEDNQLTTV